MYKPKHSFTGRQIKVGQLWLNFSWTQGKVYYSMIRNILYPVVLRKRTTTCCFCKVKLYSLMSSGLVPYVKLAFVPVRMSFLEGVTGVLQSKNRLHWQTVLVKMCLEEHNKKPPHGHVNEVKNVLFKATARCRRKDAAGAKLTRHNGLLWADTHIESINLSQ